MEIRRIDWQDTIALRHEVLWPDNDPDYCRVEGDESAWHFGAFVPDEGLVCVASVYPDGDTARLRKFATASRYPGRGIGTAVLNHFLDQLRAEPLRLFWCDARESAMGFYQRFGMEPWGDRFFKGEVPYFKMSTRLE